MIEWPILNRPRLEANVHAMRHPAGARRGLAAGLTLVLLAATTACAPRSVLPEYAQPKIMAMGVAEPAPGDGVPYRKLVREDFRATGLPADLLPIAAQMRAFSCVNVRVRYDARIDPLDPEGTSARGYRAEVESLEFYAELDRSCSWWSPRKASVPIEYVLEHEQIHFALFELAARRANRTPPRLAASAKTDQEAERQIATKIEQALASVMRAAVDENRRFDEETSLGYKPDAQKRWNARVERELSTYGVR